MGHRSQWKMIHTLNTCSKGQLTLKELNDIGINCFDDTISELFRDEIIQSNNFKKGPYRLHDVAKRIVNTFTVSLGTTNKVDVYIDQPSCFTIMPFRATWSNKVYKKLIFPAITSNKLSCKRGDDIPRDGALMTNISKAIFHSGLIIVDISDFNANVFYELGLAHALGKDTKILIQKNQQKKIPSDLKNAHYISYDINKLDEALVDLSKEIGDWVSFKKVLNMNKYSVIQQ